jgi:hypothetical protein
MKYLRNGTPEESDQSVFKQTGQREFIYIIRKFTNRL